ncbi:MAG TPA: carboxypeptidase regulatory-like domain-containing protein [Acidimicrobiales bacterium]|nr:carboxypeptidase regulatory-like domain-containing protein [Acidimicrobiales bacterium]
MPRLRFGGLVLALGLAMSACGGGGAKVSAGGRSPVTTAPGSSTTTPASTSTTALASSGSGTANGGTVNGGTAGVTGPPVSVGTATTTAGRTTTTMRSTTTTAVTTTTRPPQPPNGTGVYGYVTAGPTCPVEQAGNPCPPKPVSGQVQAHDSGGATVASTTTDSSGGYALALAPGSYTLVVVTGSSFPRCPNTPVTVGSGAPSRVDISCDTGIR